MSGVTMACFQGDGKCPPTSDKLNKFATYGAAVSAHFLSNHVGSGSDIIESLLLKRAVKSKIKQVKLYIAHVKPTPEGDCVFSGA